MPVAAIAFAALRFALWEIALFAAAMRLSDWLGWPHDVEPAERWLAILAIQLTLESSIAAAFSFSGFNSQPAYWVAATALLTVAGFRLPKVSVLPSKYFPYLAALLVPLLFLSFKPVEEIDSINYLHYLIDWMANRATPYAFATNYVAFWELSFLPAWTVTRVDLFFPLLAAKSIILLGLAVWLVGRELGLPRPLLLWTVFGSLLMRHFWYLHSGVPTLKNDALHGVGFALLTLVVVRAARRRLSSSDLALLAFGAAFASVKYTGIFVAVIVVALVIVLRRPPLRPLLLAAGFFLGTSGHYYLHNLIRSGSPFYPFQINIAFIHLPGIADLSNTSILYSLHDPRLWRAFFLPAGGISPAGLLFPAILAGTLLAGSWVVLRAVWSSVRHQTHPAPLDWVAFLILCGWLLYFRSVFSASGNAGDLSFVLNNLNSIRYVDGVLAVSELFLVALLARIDWVVWPLVAINVASRAIDLYVKVPPALFSPVLVMVSAVTVLLLFLALNRHAISVALLLLLAAAPFLVQRNRLQWTTYWNDLKPALQSVRANDMAELAFTDGGYFAGHVVAAGNPINPAVRTLLPEDLEALPPSLRPRYLAVLITSGSEAASYWRTRYRSQFTSWGYSTNVEVPFGALLERKF